MSLPSFSASTMRFLATPAARQVVQDLGGKALSPADIGRLRDRWGKENALGLIEQNAIFRGISEKFGSDRLLGTQRAVQQASDELTATHKAQRFPSGTVVFDWCCGMGGDLRAFVQRGPAIGVDRDPALCVAAAVNACGAITVCDDVAFQTPDPTSFLHVDPDRRPGQQRVIRPDLASPPLEVLESVVQRVAGAAVKLAPVAEVPESWRRNAEREWLSVRGECRQQIAWFGLTNSPGLHRAVSLDRNRQGVEFLGQPDVWADEALEVGRYLLDLDPAIRAAHLSGTFAAESGLMTVGGPAGFLTGDFPIASPLVTNFEVLEVIPLDSRRLRQMVQAFQLDVHEIKVRGVEKAPEELRRITRMKGAPAATLLVGRGTNGTFAALTKRCVSPTAAEPSDVLKPPFRSGPETRY